MLKHFVDPVTHADAIPIIMVDVWLMQVLKKKTFLKKLLLFPRLTPFQTDSSWLTYSDESQCRRTR